MLAPGQARHHRRAAADIQDPHPRPGRGPALPTGDIGEICIAGIGLARGYVNRPDLTEKAFIPDFLASPDNPSGRIYRTGDLGRITDDREIEYLGRLDAQVKIRGYRIELAEIESVIMKVPGIAQAVVGTFQPEPGHGRAGRLLHAAPRRGPPGPGADPARSRERLPAYMLPAFFERMDALPMLPCDKADRKSLPPPSGPRTSRQQSYVAPATDTERELADALTQLLRLEQVSMDDHFFNDLGANSLLMARFCARIAGAARLPTCPCGRSTCIRRLADLATPSPRRRQHRPAASGRAGPCAPPVGRAPVPAVRRPAAACFSPRPISPPCSSWSRPGMDLRGADGFAGVYLRSVAFGPPASCLLCACRIPAKWLLIGRWQRAGDSRWSLALFPLLAGQGG